MNPCSETAIQLQDAVVGYSRGFTLGPITQVMRTGEIWAVIGPNGSGKTTLLRAISGVLPCRSGSIKILSQPIGSLNPRQRAQMLACVPQWVDIPPYYTVRDVVSLGRLPHVSGWSPLRKADHDVIARCLAELDVAGLADHCVCQISAGERQRALVAMALAQDPRILLLDEPCAHLDPQHAASLMKLIVRRAGERNLAVVMALHDLHLAVSFCTHTLVLSRGVPVLAGPLPEVLATEKLGAVYNIPFEIVRLQKGGVSILPVYDGGPANSNGGGF